MQVLYDISVLGASFRAEYSGGIPRAVSALLYALQAQQSNCDIAVCAAYATRDSGAWLESQPELAHLAVEYSSFEKIEQGMARRREEALIAQLTAQEKGEHACLLGLRTWAYDAVRSTLLAPLTAARWNLQGIAQCDVFHSPWAAIPKELRRHKRVRFVQTIYDLYPVIHPEHCTISQKQFVNAILQSCNPTDWFLADSQSAKDDLCAVKNIDPERVTVTPLAADKTRFYPCNDADAMRAVRGRYGLPDDAPYLLSVCTLEPRKNLEAVVRCFVSLMRQQNRTDLYLVLAGGRGWNNAQIFAAIEDAAELKSRIIVTGFVRDEDLSPLYSGALCFVFPSLYEGFGLPPLEAMQCGTPVITSNTSSLPEVVGEAGIMVDPFDDAALCQAFYEMYSHSEARAAWSRRGLEQARKFSWERCARQTIEAYHKANGSSG